MPALARTLTMRTTCPYCWATPVETSSRRAPSAPVLHRGSCEPGSEPVVDESGRVLVYVHQEMERLTAAGRDYLETVGAHLPAVPMEPTLSGLM